MKYLNETAAQFSALGDPDRLAIMVCLMDGAQCVGTLAEKFGAGMSTISQRLKVLHIARLVHKERQGKHMFYTVADQHVRNLIENAFEHAGE